MSEHHGVTAVDSRLMMRCPAAVVTGSSVARQRMADQGEGAEGEGKNKTPSRPEALEMLFGRIATM